MKYYCNPINVPYHYQFNKDQTGQMHINREGADPSIILFKGKYYIFASMNLSVWVSEDLVTWESHALPKNLPLYDYAPDVRVCGDYVYFSASKRGEICNYYRTKDVVNGPYEEIKGTFDFWDPNLFFDDDGRIYFYWGCSNVTPIWGVELEPETMLPKTERVVICKGNPLEYGYERVGDDNTVFPCDDEEVEQSFKSFCNQQGIDEHQLSEDKRTMLKGLFSKMPYIEGPWVDKHNGKYYLQYACPGTEFNTYADGVYVADAPLGPYTLAENNPYSFHPGGFMPGAGHGSTLKDSYGNWWHTSTMRISKNHLFERRVGLWPAGFDADGELFCNQNYGDWPIDVAEAVRNPWSDPQWYLLSYGKKTSASSCASNHPAEYAVDEDAQTWWMADTNESGQWLEVDLECACDVHAIQINFADDHLDVECPGTLVGDMQGRYIEEREWMTRWILEGSVDGKEYFVIKDNSMALTDLAHDFIVMEDGKAIRYVRLMVKKVPFDVNPCVSGLRIFGKCCGDKPQKAVFDVQRSDNRLDMQVNIEGKSDAIGYNILWGHRKDKLYHSYQIYRDMADVKNGVDASIHKRIGALVKGQDYFVRVDAYNENGITRGDVIRLC